MIKIDHIVTELRNHGRQGKLSSITLRDYQSTGVAGLRSSYASKKKAPLFVLPTGGGKTVTFAYIAQGAVARGNRVIILVHRNRLLQQSSKTLTGLGVPHGLIMAGGSMRLQEAVQVASVQTIVNRFDILARAGWSPDLIVIDEAHHGTAGSWRKIIEHWSAARVLGVTATACRTDGKGLGVDAGGVFDDLVMGPQLGELIDRGYLSQPEVYAPPVVADLSGLRSRGGDFAVGEASDRMDRPTVTGDAVAHYAKICPGVPAIAFCVSVAHAEHVAEQFRASGWRAASLDGSMDLAEQNRVIDDLAGGSLDVVTSCDLISEGTDIPVVGAAILLRPTQSLGLYLQQVGRALRIYPGKSVAYIIDHVGNVGRHGLPDEDREWSLEGVTKKSKRDAEDEGKPPPATCESCWRQIVHPLPPTCPNCGCTIKPAKDRMKSLAHADGELRKLTADDKAAITANRKAEQGMADTLQGLVDLGRTRGYPNPQQWAWRVWSKRSAKKMAAAQQ